MQNTQHKHSEPPQVNRLKSHDGTTLSTSVGHPAFCSRENVPGRSGSKESSPLSSRISDQEGSPDAYQGHSRGSDTPVTVRPDLPIDDDLDGFNSVLERNPESAIIYYERRFVEARAACQKLRYQITDMEFAKKKLSSSDQEVFEALVSRQSQIRSLQQQLQNKEYLHRFSSMASFGKRYMKKGESSKLCGGYTATNERDLVDI